MYLLDMSVVSYHRFTTDIEENKCIDSADGTVAFTIGRSEQCSWCLPDPERIVSGRHARIELNANQFLLYDTSTNGLFVNRSVEALQKDHPHTLRDGDLIAIGDYEIKFSIKSHSVATEVTLKTEILDDVAIPVDVAAGSDVIFGIPAAQVKSTAEEDRSLAQSTSTVEAQQISLDSTLNASLSDAFVLPDIVPDTAVQTPSTQVESSVSPAANVSPLIPEGWGPSGSQSAAQSVTLQSSSPVPAACAESTTPAARPADNSAHACLEAFLDGMGISPDQIPPDYRERWWRQLGVITRDAMNGLMDSLHKRSEFKQNSRINQTTFKRQENNPLKFSSNLEDAIHNLLERKSAGFLPPERAVKEAFRDLERHDAGLLAGVDGVACGLMKLLDPALIVSNAPRSEFLGRFRAFDGKQSWIQYKRVYAELSAELNKDGQSFYFEDFSKAYEERLKRDE